MQPTPMAMTPMRLPTVTPPIETVPFNREQQQKRLATAERKLAQLGRVNPLALEEFAALEQRHKFLTEQLTDLTNTRKDLLTIIEEIDEKMQTIFESAFEDTRDAFGYVFPILFPGGTGSISLDRSGESADHGYRGLGQARRQEDRAAVAALRRFFRQRWFSSLSWRIWT